MIRDKHKDGKELNTVTICYRLSCYKAFHRTTFTSI